MQSRYKKRFLSQNIDVQTFKLKVKIETALRKTRQIFEVGEGSVVTC